MSAPVTIRRGEPAPTGVLRDSVGRLVGRWWPGARVVRLERSPARRRSSWWLEDLRVTLDDGTVLEVVFKDLGLSVHGSAEERAKPERLVDPGREPWAYRALLRRLRSGTASCLGVVALTDPDRHWLFLERVRGVPLAEVGDPAAWEAAARWLGRFHAAAGRWTSRTGPLIRHDAGLHAWWFGRALSLAEEEGAATEALRRIRSIHRAATEELMGLPRTLLHGEFYASNVLMDTARVCPVDWEMAAVGPGVLDLAALTAGGWSPEERAGMALAYLEAARAGGLPMGSLDGLLRALTAARLLLAIQWLGWRRGWVPPLEHRQDWLGEAQRCAGALEET